jgi:glutamyl-tRNA synthetase
MTTLTKPVRVRFAPSPTGFLHAGSARTALYNYLLAKQTGGKFIIRIEDTDHKRYNPKSISDMLDGLRFLGLTWDEGPDIGGPYGPYIQTQRVEIYQKYVKELLAKGGGYRCFCTPERLAQINEERKKARLPLGYDRFCRNIDPAESDRRAAAGEPFVVRIKIPLEGSVTLHDAIRGDITIENKLVQDAVLIKSNGIPTYHFAVVIDDHLMEITHALRAEEWISSFPLHLHLYDFFGWEKPVFAHLPIILNPAGKGKMSKREGRAPDGKLYPVFIHTYKEMGYLPEALVNYLALVGWSYDDKTEIMTREELIERFSLERVSSSPAAWNYEKLDHFNSVYIRGLAIEDLTGRLMPYLEAAGVKADRETVLKLAPLIQERLVLLRNAADWVDFFFVTQLPAYDLSLLVPKKMELADIPQILETARSILAETEFNHEALEVALRAGAERLGLKAGQMFQPIRVAVCGKIVAPPLFETLEILGQEKTLKRIEQALERLGVVVRS